MSGEERAAEVVAAAFKNLKAMKCSCKQTGKSQVSEMRDHSVARTASRWLEHEEERRLAQERLNAGPDADARKWEFSKGLSVTEATAVDEGGDGSNRSLGTLDADDVWA